MDDRDGGSGLSQISRSFNALWATEWEHYYSLLKVFYNVLIIHSLLACIIKYWIAVDCRSRFYWIQYFT